MEESKYCWRCGTELSEEILCTFDVQTGKPNIGKICKKCNPCNHEYKNLPWWYPFFDYRCKKCGEKGKHLR